MFFRKLKQEQEQLRWKVQSLEDKNKMLRQDFEKALQVLRSQVVRVKKGDEISEEMIVKGRVFDSIEGKSVPEFMEKNPDVLFLDVRTQAEFNSGYIPGATHIPVDQLQYRFEELIDFKDQPVITYCSSGNRSEVACEMLAEKGFFRVYNLLDGIGGYPQSLERNTQFQSPVVPIKRDRPRSSEEEELAQRVKKIFEEQINPVVAAHGGVIEILDVIENNVYVKMGGGCQGCSSASLTLRQGVEQTLKTEIPNFGKLFDTTDHASGTNPYYAG